MENILIFQIPPIAVTGTARSNGRVEATPTLHLIVHAYFLEVMT